MKSVIGNRSAVVLLGAGALLCAHEMTGSARADVILQGLSLDATSWSSAGIPVTPFNASYQLSPSPAPYKITVPSGYVLQLQELSGNWVSNMDSRITPYLAISFTTVNGVPVEFDYSMSDNQLKPTTFSTTAMTTFQFDHPLSLSVDGGCGTNGAVVSFSERATLGTNFIQTGQVAVAATVVPRNCP